MLGGAVWNTLPERSTMTAEQFAATLEPLLHGVAAAVTGFAPEVLKRQIRATLATTGRETSLPLPQSAGEFAAQAATIGAVLPGGEDDLVLLALLGRLYPENVVLDGAPGRGPTPPGVARTVISLSGTRT